MKYLYELSKKFTFEAAHKLTSVPGDHKCAKLHGHNFTVKVTISGYMDIKTGFIIDYNKISEAIKPVRKELDHKYLNDIEELKNPTSELLTLYILKKIKLPKEVKLVSVELRETSTSSCKIYA